MMYCVSRHFAAVDNSQIPKAANGAVYKGLAFGVNINGVFLFATNFRTGIAAILFSLTRGGEPQTSPAAPPWLPCAPRAGSPPSLGSPAPPPVIVAVIKLPMPLARWSAAVNKEGRDATPGKFGRADLGSAAFEILGDLVVILRDTEQQGF
jgi:hypothetical protein